MSETQTPSLNVSIKSETQHALIVATFKDNDSLLLALRSVLLGLSPSDQEKDLIRTLSPEVRAVIREKFMPVLDKESPLGVLSDCWLGLEEDIKGQSRDTIYQSVHAQRIGIELTETALALLDNPDGAAPDLSYDPKKSYGTGEDNALQVFLLGRNKYIRLVNNQLYVLRTLANQKVETPTQIARRELKDSAK